MSAHINKDAKFAKTVLMPGDPLRAKYIAENFLADYEEVTSVRGILGFTGHTKSGKEISIMASGMGCPSIGIYSYELYSFFGVETIIRIGTAGSYQPDCHIGDVVLATTAFSNSNYASQIRVPGLSISPSSDFELLLKIYNNAKAMGLKLHVGPIYSSDIFYDANKDGVKVMSDLGVLAVEMESYALFINAMVLHKKAACILTISDSLVSKEKEMTPEERQTTLTNMFNLGISLAE